MRKREPIFLLLALLLAATFSTASAHDQHPGGGSGDPVHGDDHDHDKGIDQGVPSIRGPFPDTEGMEFLGQLTTDELGVERLIYTGMRFLSDLWGWTSPAGEEYAIVGTNSGAAFVRITDPRSPVYLGSIATPNPDTQNNWWWEIKTYGHYAYIVTEVRDAGILIVDLSQLDGLTGPAEPGSELDADYTFYRPQGFRAAHNISINADTGYAYLTGVTHTGLAPRALWVLDLNGDPWAPAPVGAVNGPYTHDAQIVTYHGPDAGYAGREIAFVYQGADEVLGIYDVTDKANLVTLSLTHYPGAAFTHQGWVTEEHDFLFLGDEEDELFGISDPQNPDYPDTARTYIFDIRDLDAPALHGFYDHEQASIDHNMFVKGDMLYQANYIAGVLALKINRDANGGVTLTEAGHMDTEPRFGDQHMNWGYNIWVGPWGVYPFFDSGTIIAGDGLNGLILMRMAD